MNLTEIREALEDIDPEILTADGFDEALIGYVEVFNNTVALYDRAKCIEILMGEGITRSEADEYFDFNVQGAFVGPKTPAFATLLRGLPDR
jgi:hypothetical protein